MPRVVSDQRWKYENDELFRKLSHESEVRYIGAKEKQQHEKRANLIEDCRRRQVEIAFVRCGITLTLFFKSVYESHTQQGTDYVLVDRNNNRIIMVSPFIFNGVCVIFRGWLDLDTLDGCGYIEFDSEAARDENERMLQQIFPEGQKICLPINFNPQYPLTPPDPMHYNPPQLQQQQPQEPTSLRKSFENIQVSGNQPSNQLHPPQPAPLSDCSDGRAKKPQTHEAHWKKRIRKYSEPAPNETHATTQEGSGRIPFPVGVQDFFKTPSIDHRPLQSHQVESTERDKHSLEPVLDLSKSSKTHPPAKELLKKQVSLDEDRIASRVSNVSLRNLETIRLPKKKYVYMISNDPTSNSNASPSNASNVIPSQQSLTLPSPPPSSILPTNHLYLHQFLGRTECQESLDETHSYTMTPYDLTVKASLRSLRGVKEEEPVLISSRQLRTVDTEDLRNVISIGGGENGPNSSKTKRN